MYQVTKTFGNDLGLSCCFRQWRAESHCSKLHGYSIGVRVVLQSAYLNEKNWVYDFGSFKPFKEWLRSMFDHKLLIAADDPYLKTFSNHENLDAFDLIVVKNVGCEAFAEMAFHEMQRIRSLDIKEGRCEVEVEVVSVEVFEHGANSATYINNNLRNK